MKKRVDLGSKSETKKPSVKEVKNKSQATKKGQKPPGPDLSYLHELSRSKQGLTSPINSPKMKILIAATVVKSTSSNNLLAASPKLSKSRRALDHEYIYLCKTQSSPNILVEEAAVVSPTKTKKTAAISSKMKSKNNKKPSPPTRSQNPVNVYESLNNFESQTLVNPKPQSVKAAKAVKKTSVNKPKPTATVKKKPPSISSVTSSRTSMSSSSRRPRKVTLIEFVDEWMRQKRMFLNIQFVFLIINFILTIIRLALSVALYAGKRVSLLSDMANKLLYSSFSKFVGLLPLIFLLVNTVAFFVDISRFFSHFYIRDLLEAHTPVKIRRIITNQNRMRTLRLDTEDTIDTEFGHLRTRNATTSYLKRVIGQLKAVTFMGYFVYITVVAVQFIIGLVLHFHLDYIVSYQLPQTLMKLTREYESQQLALLTKSDTLFLKMENVITGTIEESLVNGINIYFECCNYQNPFQYGDLAPHTCNYDRGCLKPMQDFTWTYVYASVVLVLFLAAVKFLIEILLAVNFNIVLLKRLIVNVYHVDFDLIIVPVVDKNEEEDEDEDVEAGSDRDGKAVERRLAAIRHAKELQLAREEVEEEKRRREETRARLLGAQDRRQEAYERMLLEQGRFDELEQERYRRRLQSQFLNIENETET
jgi:hypothetical protein